MFHFNKKNKPAGSRFQRARNTHKQLKIKQLRLILLFCKISDQKENSHTKCYESRNGEQND